MYWVKGKLITGPAPIKSGSLNKKAKTPRWAAGYKETELRATASCNNKGCCSIFYQGQKPIGHYNTHKS